MSVGLHSLFNQIITGKLIHPKHYLLYPSANIYPSALPISSVMQKTASFLVISMCLFFLITDVTNNLNMFTLNNYWIWIFKDLTTMKTE